MGGGWANTPLESLLAKFDAALEWPLRNAKHKFETNSLFCRATNLECL